MKKQVGSSMNLSLPWTHKWVNSVLHNWTEVKSKGMKERSLAWWVIWLLSSLGKGSVCLCGLPSSCSITAHNPGRNCWNEESTCCWPVLMCLPATQWLRSDSWYIASGFNCLQKNTHSVTLLPSIFRQDILWLAAVQEDSAWVLFPLLGSARCHPECWCFVCCHFVRKWDGMARPTGWSGSLVCGVHKSQLYNLEPEEKWGCKALCSKSSTCLVLLKILKCKMSHFPWSLFLPATILFLFAI